MRRLILIVTLVVTFAVSAIVAGPAMAQMQGDRSSKDWDIYSWQDGNDWRFSLLFGTNRTAWCTEVKHPKAAMTLEQLEEALTKLAEAQNVYWAPPGAAGLQDACEIAYPPPGVVERLRQLCRRLGLMQSDRASPPDSTPR